MGMVIYCLVFTVKWKISFHLALWNASRALWRHTRLPEMDSTGDASKRKIGRHLSPHDRMKKKRGENDGRRENVSELREKVYSNVSHHTAEILQQ